MAVTAEAGTAVAEVAEVAVVAVVEAAVAKAVTVEEVVAQQDGEDLSAASRGSRD